MSIAALIAEYTAGIKALNRYKKTLDRNDPAAAEEARTVSSMLSDMRYALEWMRRGRRPGSRRGAERHDVYRRRELLAKTEPLTGEERQRLLDCMAVMTERELTCWLLHMAQGFTYAEIAARLNLSRRTVQQYVERARKKVHDALGRTDDVRMTCG
jgi:RNA polymerase sigma-70 factor (ECF subfamily)